MIRSCHKRIIFFFHLGWHSGEQNNHRKILMDSSQFEHSWYWLSLKPDQKVCNQILCVLSDQNRMGWSFTNLIDQIDMAGQDGPVGGKNQDHCIFIRLLNRNF